MVFFRLRLVLYFESIRSERKLIETADLHLTRRWYLGYALEDHRQVEFEENDWINGGSAALGIELPRPATHEVQIELRFQMPVRMSGRDELLNRNSDRVRWLVGFGGSSIGRLLPLRGDAGLSLGVVCRLRTPSV